MNKYPVLTIDGPAGSGKGTIAKRVAQTLGWQLLDSGALYRLIAVVAQNKEIPFDDGTRLAELAKKLNAVFLPCKSGVEVRLDGDDVTQAIRTEDCGCAASKVAANAGVRKALLQRQRDYLVSPGLVADGRDMGTVVFPDAQTKIFLTATAKERAKRRFNQLNEKGVSATLAGLILEIQERDARDMNRAEAPLVAASDAVTIDTSELSIEQVVAQVLSLVAEKK
ncbi:MAG TPA: (d)CMP kinase [Leucothrix mucor]|uniref:Cytidylate kinase n=1 Tax=Leucothrix mucor TaxID=45248 RepID=A0A7V2SYU1_LEUMU|nr:(d)CMP kinase [Leucothrix mucor]